MAANIADKSGLRERKKRATRVAIQRAALSLFLSKGYDKTTTEEIARAADISTGTLFNYFPTKEDLVADDYDPLFIHLLETRPLSEPLFTAIRKALEEGLATVVTEDRDFLLVRGKLALEVPALRAAAALDRERSAALLNHIIVQRCQCADDSFELRTVSSLIVSALTSAMDAWLESGGKADLLQFVGRALDIAEQGAQAVMSSVKSGEDGRSSKSRRSSVLK